MHPGDDREPLKGQQLVALGSSQVWWAHREGPSAGLGERAACAWERVFGLRPDG